MALTGSLGLEGLESGVSVGSRERVVVFPAVPSLVDSCADDDWSLRC